MHNTPKRSNRVLSVFGLVMINVIAIDSLRNLPVNAKTGLMVIVLYIVASLLFLLPCALITAELATHRPKTGGVYVWVREAFGAKWGFFTIWMQWIYNVFWYPTILSFIAANMAYLINPALAESKAFMLPLVVAMFTIATLANIFGMRLSSLVSTLGAIGGTLIPMSFIIGIGVYWLLSGKPLAIQPSWHHLAFNVFDWHNLALLVVIIFSLMGLEMSAVHAEEVHQPQRDFPRALTYSGLIIAITMILGSAAIAIIVPPQALNIVSGIDQAFELFLNHVQLGWLLPILIVLIILGAFGGMAAWVIGPPKGLVIAAEDGCAPHWLGYRNQKNVPVTILIAQWVLVILICGLFLLFKQISTSYWILSDLTAQLALLFYILFFAAGIKLRGKTPKSPLAYRIPGGRVGIWIAGMMGIIICAAAIILGFFPPSSIPTGNIWVYEGLLFGGLIIFAGLPFVLFKYQSQ